jgi:hypothetical protein
MFPRELTVASSLTTPLMPRCNANWGVAGGATFTGFGSMSAGGLGCADF